MPVSVFLARLLGPLLLLPGIGLLVNPRAFRTMATEVVGSPTLVYLFGLLGSRRVSRFCSSTMYGP